MYTRLEIKIDVNFPSYLVSNFSLNLYVRIDCEDRLHLLSVQGIMKVQLGRLVTALPLFGVLPTYPMTLVGGGIAEQYRVTALNLIQRKQEMDEGSMLFYRWR